MRQLKWAVVVAGFVAAAVGIGALGQAQQGLSGEYKIGILEPLTGNLAAEGKRHLEGMEIMRDLINERFGGVMGKKLTFVVGDAVDPTVAASEATRLATQGGVKIIAGTFSSTLCGAASEAAARQGVIYWETSCVDPRLTKRGLKNVYRTEIDGTGFGWYNIEFIAKHLAHRLGKKTNELRIAYLSEDSSYGQSVTESARQRAKQEFGMQETGVEYYTFTTNDLTSTILKLKGQNPDILHHIARNQDAILFWRQAREQNFEVKAVVHAGATGYGSPDFGKAFGNDANGPFALLEPGPGFVIEKLRPERTAHRARVPRGGEGQDGGGHRGRTSARGRRALGAQAGARRRQDRRPRQVPRRRDGAGHAHRHRAQRLGREVRRERSELQPARAALHAPVAERGRSSPCGRKSSRPSAPSGSRSAPGTSGSSDRLRLALARRRPGRFPGRRAFGRLRELTCTTSPSSPSPPCCWAASTRSSPSV